MIMRSSTSKDFRAFSLIELLVVMALLGILMVLTLPAVTSIQKSNSLTKAGSDIASVLKLARTYAMANNISVWVGFFNSPEGVNIGVISSRVAGGGPAASQIARVVLHPNVRIVELPSDERRPDADARLSVIGKSEGLPEFALGSNIFEYVLQFTSRGEAKARQNSLSKRIEIALQHSVDGEVPASMKENYCAVQIGALSGNIGVYRP